ncbi:hypothetical protein NECAME_02473 [Necator americanus]|uniref:Kunitz/Bovine pancreatic trypsin inhibitor domain protein n=1 Tax=Necator americanus TaxID=51031 RepID=W2TD70_NECAM|nr:hypothetical protein NECAME_02473 [Necator americanus]ETN79995.1 hypothetical protein NECAME_02473 [Necator americanus]
MEGKEPAALVENEHTVGDEQWNKFASQEQCVDFCVGKCPNHLDVHYNPLTGQPQLCDARSNSGCPLGFECVRTMALENVVILILQTLVQNTILVSKRRIW